MTDQQARRLGELLRRGRNKKGAPAFDVGRLVAGLGA